MRVPGSVVGFQGRAELMPLLHACPNCGTAHQGKGRCPRCKRSANKTKRTRPSWSQVYNTARWRLLRTHILDRDGYVCQYNLPGCTIKATHAGHIHPFTSADDPSAWDEDNIAASCATCNGREAATRQGAHR